MPADIPHRTAQRPARKLLAAALAASLIAPAGAAGLVDAVEFYNAALDHYFVTALPDEIGKLDSGFFVGWQRTNQRFKVFDPATPGTGANPVCRFYGNPDV